MNNNLATITQTGTGWTIYPPDSATPTGNFASYGDAERACSRNGWEVANDS